MNIQGVKLADLCTRADGRGSLTEIFREAWFSQPAVQWNYVRSIAGVLRGVHGHFRHTDYLVVLEGSAVIGLKDLRPDSPTYGDAETVELRSRNLRALTIPPGVAHGFYFNQPSTLVYGVTHCWDGEDELGCRWDDPALGIPWPFTSATVSDRDAALPGLDVFTAQIQGKLALAA